MKATVSPSDLAGNIYAPASKSSMQRACAAALLAKGKSIISNPGVSNDDRAALNIIQQLGASVQSIGDKIIIESNGVKPVAGEINCGESGLSVRMFTSIAALSEKPITITGHGSLTTRPMDFFNEVLPQLNVDCNSNNGRLPMQITGPLQPKNITVDGSLSSQFLTGLLFSFAAANASDVTISVTNLNSRPYIDLTLEVMKNFGLKVPVNKDYKEFYFPATNKKNSTSEINFTVEGDWSGAAFLLVGGAIAGDIVIKGLDIFSAQADKAILQALAQADAVMSIEEEQITIRKGNLKSFHFNATDCPDLFPPLVALAAYCNGKSVIEGVSRLAHKESNRALTLQQEFETLGIQIDLQDDLMIVHGNADGVKKGKVASHNDHRIAMACAVAALKASGEVEISSAEAVNKSYPNFWQHLKDLGAAVSTQQN